jgi:hypothetical protein
MFGRNRQDNTSSEMREIRDTALRESHPYTDSRANYPTAERYRQVRAEGTALSDRHTA